MTRAWTVAEMIVHLGELPPDAKVTITDADTGWTIPTFSIDLSKEDGTVWINPCDYNEMVS